MNDLFLRQQITSLTGLTVYDQAVGNSTVVPATTWTSLDIQDFSQPLDVHTIITSFQIDSDVGDTTFKFLANGVKIFPHADDMAVLSGVANHLQFKIQLPAGTTFDIQAYTPTGGNVQLNYLSIIEVDSYSHG